MFQRPHDCQEFTPGDAVIHLDLIQRLTVVGNYSLLSVLYLGDHAFNLDVTHVSVQDEPVSWLRVSKNKAVRRVTFIA
jgi:hypothetical protein